MGTPDDLRSIQEELKWISMNEKSTLKEKALGRGINGVLVPLGCLVTVGILANGLYNFLKRDSAKQQKMMRYRVLAQGVTIVIATMGIFQYRLDFGKMTKG